MLKICLCSLNHLTNIINFINEYFLANVSLHIRNRHYIEYLDGENGEITSLGYPCKYPNNVNYTWILKTGNNKTSVNFYILDVQAETRGDWSCYDYLKVSKCISGYKDVCFFLSVGKMKRFIFTFGLYDKTLFSS